MCVYSTRAYGPAVFFHRFPQRVSRDRDVFRAQLRNYIDPVA